MRKGASLEVRHRLSLVSDDQSSLPRTAYPQTARNQLSVEVHEARTRQEKEQLFHFRYPFETEILDGVQCHTDHRRKRVQDDLDIGAANLLAVRQSELVGAIRINYAWRCALGIHADFYRMREVAGSDHPSRSCIVSRLVLDPGSRGDRLGYRLCTAAYQHALEHGARIAFLNCKDHLIYYFSVLGFKAYMGRTWHAEYGQVVPMKLDLLDEKYLMSIGSPLLPVLRGWKQSGQPSPVD
ncbi:MAG: GNAT family N-acetyltransferase [Betaproteobacteria bacterium]|nr:MAG: GNAT family N-acetyltransferase [Betaproteobacteria bacterium]